MVVVLESEIYERTETCRIEGAETDYEKQDTRRPNRKMLLFGVIGIIDSVLPSFPKRGQDDECKEYCYDERGVKMQAADGNNRLKIKGK